MAAVSGAVGSEIRSKMRRNNGIGAERGASPARCCVLLPGHECDSEQSPDPTQDSYVCGVHSVSSLCKMYFRELPNPLLSDRLYEQLSDTVLYHGASPCGCLLLPQSCSHWRRHRHRRGHSNSPVVSDSREIEVEEGPAALQGKCHPVSGFPSERKSPANEMKKSAAGSWHSCFSLGKSPSVAKQIAAQTQEPSEAKVVAVEGESNRFRPRRPRPSSGALCTSFSAELSGSTNRCSSDDNLPHDNSDGDKALICVPAPMSPGSAEDADLSPPAIAVASLDCDSVSFQCSPPHAESECPGSSTSMRSRKQQPAGHQSVSVVIRRLCWLSEGSTDHERSSLTIRGLH